MYTMAKLDIELVDAIGIDNHKKPAFGSSRCVWTAHHPMTEIQCEPEFTQATPLKIGTCPFSNVMKRLMFV
jgi:hypothetical protein